LAVVVIKAALDRPEPDPVVYIAGGPGSPLTSRAGVIAAHQAGAIAIDRDLILVDQRGAGRSEPKLCPELAQRQLALFAAGLGMKALIEARQKSFADCRRAMDLEGLRPEWFGTQVSAADIDDVRQALGIERWNIYALSYGTAVAMTMLALHPQPLRTVVLDSVYPPDPLPMTRPQSFDRALNLLFKVCREDGACAAAYPDLAHTYEEALVRLDAEPLPVALPPALGVGSINLRAAVFRLIVNRSLYSRSGMAELPAFIRAARDRDVAVLQPLVGRVAQGFVSMSIGVMAAVECRDRASWRISDERDGAPDLASAFGQGLCVDWSALGPPVLMAPDTIVPTLILSGDADPITPPAFGRQAAATLGLHARLVIFAHVGHGAEEASSCGEAIVSAFVRAGSTDINTACAAAIPAMPFR
jgi:pimeloyl-ACP methyl ester carboxylesterase